MSESEWLLRIPTLSINPDMATRRDVARLASELMVARKALCQLRDLDTGQAVKEIALSGLGASEKRKGSEMANKDLKRTPHNINENCWWYEEAAGITVVVRPQTATIKIKWSALRAALARKDKKATNGKS